jgi:hypothetical protein
VIFFRRFFICKNILKKLSCYHDNYFRHFMFGKYNGFVSKARVSACMYFLVLILICSTIDVQILSVRASEYCRPMFSQNALQISLVEGSWSLSLFIVRSEIYIVFFWNMQAQVFAVDFRIHFMFETKFTH